MSASQASQADKTSRFVYIGLGLLGLAFVVGLGSFLFFSLRPRGEKVGSTSLTEPGAVLAVPGNSGDSLVFRVDASVGVPRLGLSSDDQLEQTARARLRQSMLTVRAIAPSGKERQSTCPLSNGRTASTSSTSGTFSCSGMLNDCVIALDEPGSWRVSGSVAWASDVTVKSASLETRLAAVAH